jgi:hypothetical protein
MQDFIFVQFFHMPACNACGKKYMTKQLLTISVKDIIWVLIYAFFSTTGEFIYFNF